MFFPVISLLYLFGAFVVHQHYEKEGEVTIADLLMFLVSPFSMVSVLLMRLVSTIIDVDTVLLKK